MGATMPKLNWKIAEVIERCPVAMAVFIRYRMACVGCAMAPFETLAEGATAYQLKPDDLLAAFRRECDSRANEHSNRKPHFGG